MTTGMALRVFGVFYAALVLTIGFEVSSTWSDRPDRLGASVQAGSGAGPATRSTSAPDHPDPIDQMVETVLARPLFSPSRRPPAFAVENAAMPRLSGIVLSPAGRVAIFQRASGTRTIVVAPGGTIDGWTVKDIATDAISLARASESVTMQPKFEAGPAAVAATAPAPPKQAPTSRWTQAAASGVLRSRWSDPQLQPRRRRSSASRR